METIRFDRAKFKELVLYIAGKSLDDPRFGRTKLHKLLCYSDFYAYGLLGAPITGATYVRKAHGPMAKDYLVILSEMVRSEVATEIDRPFLDKFQKVVIPLRAALLNAFGARELELVDTLIGEFKDYGADDMSAHSHSEVRGWKLAHDGQEIPYEAVFLSCDELTESDVARGQALADQYGWAA